MGKINFAIVVCVLGLLPSCVGPNALAERVVARATRGDVTVALIEGDCRLKSEITNLPYRATWTEKAKTFEGCYTIFSNGIVVMYFEDRTAAAAPVAQFEPVRPSI